MKALLILPAKDEAENLRPLLEAVASVRQREHLDLAVLVVDDGSTDDTPTVAVSLQAQYPYLAVTRHAGNRGLGRAIRTGLACAQSGSYVAACVMDADLSQDPADLPRLLRAIGAGADLVVGSRYVSGGGMVGVPAWRKAISIAGNALGRRVLRLPIRDLTSGFRAFRVSRLASLPLEEDGYGIQLEAVVKASLAGLRIEEVPMTLRVRRHGTSKLLYNAVFWKRYLALFWRAIRWTHEGRQDRAERR